MKPIIIFLLLLLPLTLFADADKQKKWSTLSERNVFTVEVFPKAGEYSIGDYHQWLVVVQDLVGKPVENAQIAISGGMVGHGHGMPSQPVISRYLGNGQYLIDGMLFNMMGEWTLLFNIQTSISKDRARFDIELTF
ncbi:MAG: FixH family protein [Cellvibrionaceae bacterium]